MSKTVLKAISKLTKPEALAELEVLNVDVDFGKDAWNETTSVKDLQSLVREGREVLEDGADDDDDNGSGNSDDSKDSAKAGEVKKEGADHPSDSEEAKPERLQPSTQSGEGSGSKLPQTQVEKSPKKGEDYLQKYQYKKVNGNPVVGGKMTDPEPNSKAATMKAFLLKQDRVRIMIPVEAGSNPNFRLSVNLNGYRLDLPRATYFDVPEQIANVVMESQKQQVEAKKAFLIDPDTADKALLGR